MRSFNFFLLFIGFSLYCFSQSGDINHRKYWYYRSRLTNDFMKVGHNPGESLPLSNRSKYAYNGPCVQIGTDAVSQLGPYICVLATEYKLLKDHNQPTDSTLKEIYYALDAFNRLDYYAEPIYGYGQGGYPNALNGFFIREDAPCGFISDANLPNQHNQKHFNYDLNTIPDNVLQANPALANSCGGFCSPSHAGDLIINCSNSNAYDSEEPYCRWENNKNNPNRQEELAMSLDQTINMFNACALINKFFDLGVAYQINGAEQYFMDGLSDIRAEARAISNRMLTALQGSGNWIITMPGGNHVAQGNGGHAFNLSFAFAEADCKIQKSNTATNSDIPCLGNQNIISGYAGYQVWSGYTSLAGAAFDAINPDNAPKAIGLEAACNCDYTLNPVSILVGFIYSVIEYVIGWIHYFTQGSGIPQYNTSYLVGNVTPNRIENRSGYFYLQWGPLLRKVIHGGTNFSYNGFNYESFMDDAPCDGPRWFSDRTDNPPYRWNTVDNIDHANDQSTNAEFNGLDYMLYHNLYCIDNPTYYTNPFDQRYRELAPGANYPFNNGSFSQGSNSHPVTVRANEYITAENTINATNATSATDPANANVAYKAGKKIHLLPGFNVKPGANFHGYIEKPTCGGNNDVNRVTQNNSNAPTDYLTDDIYNQPTKFIEYPPAPKEETEQSTPQSYIGHSASSGQIYQNTKASAAPTFDKMEVYPNPGVGNFMVEFYLYDNETANVNVVDMIGTTVFTKETSVNTNKFEVDVHDFGKGIYFVKMNSDKGRSFIKKIVVQ